MSTTASHNSAPTPTVEYLTAQRRAHRISQYALAKALGRTQAWVSSYERGDRDLLAEELAGVERCLHKLIVAERRRKARR